MEFLYRLLLRLHPEEFRERFGPEMMLNLEETRPERSWGLVVDCFISVWLQWFLRMGLWKLGVAAVFAWLELAVMGTWWRLRFSLPHHLGLAAKNVQEPDGLRMVMMCVAISVVLIAVLTALWVRSLVTARWKESNRRRYSVMQVR